MDSVQRHQCLIYAGSPSNQLHALTPTIVAKLKANMRCMYLNSPPMVAEMRTLLSFSVDVEECVRSGALILSASNDHLMDGLFDAERMLGTIGDAVNEALKDGYEGLFATGDMTWEFGSEINFSKILDYEYGLEALFRKHPALSGVCQYHTDTLPTEFVYRGLCTHRSIYVNETLSRMNPFYASPQSRVHQRPGVSAIALQSMLHLIHATH